MSNFEEKVLDFFKKNIHIILVVLTVVGGLWARKKGIWFESGDYKYFLSEWFKIFKGLGGIHSLYAPYYNYYIPYVIIVGLPSYIDSFTTDDLLIYLKGISIFFELLSATMAMLIAKKALQEFNKQTKCYVLVFVAVFLSPMVVLNGAFWCQCDYIYLFFVLAAIYAYMNNKMNLVFILLGVSLAFKFQMVEIVPLFALLYLCNKKFSILKVGWTLLVFFVAGLPAIFVGKSFADTYLTYFNIVGMDSVLSVNALNIYNFFPNSRRNEFLIFGMIIFVTLLAIVAYWFVSNGFMFDTKLIIYTAVISAGICYIFMPNMHERYCAMWVLMAYIYYIVYDRKRIFLPIVLDAVAITKYFSYLYPEEYSPGVSWAVLSIVNIVILLYMLSDWMKVVKEQNQHMSEMIDG